MKKKLKNLNYLELTPLKKFGEESDEKGLASILIPRFKIEALNNLIPKSRSKYIKVKLDEFGSATWFAINGENNVKKICTILTEKFGEKIQPAEERITKFLSTLYHQRCIYFKELGSK
ncbi:MAG: PqqD family protein [Bacteroidia bacterium]|nr:PqqD family protein [Bacteroidia bacterium]